MIIKILFWVIVIALLWIHCLTMNDLRRQRKQAWAELERINMEIFKLCDEILNG